MSTYQSVTDALAAGADPHMLCETCPWDRNCINPPTMTASEVRRKVEAKPENEDGKTDNIISSLVNIMAFSGKDTSANICPVFAVRLRSSDGRALNDLVRATMLGAEATT